MGKSYVKGPNPILVLLLATWAAMSYPDISAVILDASFDDLVPLALKVMPDSWRECSSQAGPSQGGWQHSSSDWVLRVMWVGIGHPTAERRASLPSGQWGPLC